MYALVAGAAGVGMLALAQPAEAKIVYTPAHAKVIGPLPVDLNHDGIVDFYLLIEGHSDQIRLAACQYWHTYIDGVFCSLSGRGRNAMRTIDSKGWKFGAALRHGEKIQHGEKFAKSRVVLGGVVIDGGSNTWYGPWVDGGKGIKNRYLGLQFKIKGKLHYGWARITVTTTSYIRATLTGYAYETIPGKAIVAGATKGPDDEPTTSFNTHAPQPATLGILALGAPGLSIWKREESAGCHNRT
jgi:hypothetical protein